MTIALISLIASTFLFFLFLTFKAPSLASLPDKKSKEKPILSSTREKTLSFIKKIRKDFSSYKILQGILSFIRKISLSTARMTSSWMNTLKKKNGKNE